MVYIILGKTINPMFPLKRKNVMYKLQSEVKEPVVDPVMSNVLEQTSVEELEGQGFAVKTGQGFSVKTGVKGGNVGQPKNEKLRKFVSLKIKR